MGHARVTRNTYNILVGKCQGKRPHGRPSHRWQNNSKIGVREIILASAS